ncbi:hypothetical protein ATANTOWER_017612 [Ataeniobius toweri]|uniref:Uncharacterized protein n=1 Tax=Ataeniobius toweri TaxID=208326 RepID=A0ABU7CHN8_9TELE|nr:hypothetical protein [Ataeniobius toweri]
MKTYTQCLRKLKYCEKVHWKLMVSHPNQLINSKHLQRFPELLNGLSVWVIGYTIMGKTADWTDVQKTVIKPFTRRVSHKKSLLKRMIVHSVLYPSILTGN